MEYCRANVEVVKALQEAPGEGFQLGVESEAGAFWGDEGFGFDLELCGEVVWLEEGMC